MASDSVLSGRLGMAAAQPDAGLAAEEYRDVRALFEAHYAVVWRLLRRFGVPLAQLDDAAQEVFWVATRRFADIERGRERAFLYGVALRVASNELRRAAVSAELTQPLDDWSFLLGDVAPTPEESLEHRRALQMLDAVLVRLPLELRTVLVLFELEGLEVSKIADIEGIPLGTVSSRLRRARQEFLAISKRLRASLSRGGQP